MKAKSVASPADQGISQVQWHAFQTFYKDVFRSPPHPALLHFVFLCVSSALAVL